MTEVSDLSANPSDPMPIFLAILIIIASIASIVIWTIYKAVKKIDLEAREKPQPSPFQVKKKLKRRLNIKTILLVLGVLLVYFALLIPYVVHANLNNAGIVVYSRDITIESLPKDIQEICRLRGINPTTLLLVKHTNPKWTTIVITSSQFSNNEMVEITYYVVNWRLDWRDINLVDQRFDRFAIANLKLLSPFESWVESALSNQLGGYLRDLSLADFYVGPVFLVLCITLLTVKRLAVWNIPAIWGCYSFQVLMSNMLARSHNVYVATEWSYFGYLFLGLLPITVYLWHYEKTEAGQSVAGKMKAVSKFLGLLRH